MVFQKTEWYLFILAALTMALIYNVAFVNIAKGGSGAVSTILNSVMGRSATGAFQKPF